MARGDVGTPRAHVRALDRSDGQAGALYRELARRTVPLGTARGSRSPERAHEVRAALAAAPGRRSE